MISGTADDRLAFVIETDARLDGIKAARSELAGFAADTQKSGVASVAATRNLSAWGALQAEAAGHVGEHSLAIGRLERELESFGSRAAGVNPIIGLLSTSLLKFGIGSVETVGILAGIAAIAAIYDRLTESARKTTEEQNKAIEAFEKMRREKAEGPEGAVVSALNAQIAEATATLNDLRAMSARDNAPGQLSGGAFANVGGRAAETQKEIDKQNAILTSALAYRSEILEKDSENTDRTFASNLATLVTFNARDEAARRNSLALISAYQADLAQLGDADVAKRAEIIGKIKALRAPFEAEERAAAATSKALMEAQLRDAVRIGDAAQRAVNEVLANNDKAVAQLEAMRVRTLETRASAMDPTSVAGGLSAIAVIQAQREQRDQEIQAMHISNDLKLALQKAADDQMVAEVDALNRRINASNDDRDAREDRARRTTEEKVRAAEKRKAAILLSSVDAYVKGSESLQKTLIRLALDPLIKELEGTAVRQFVRAAASAAALDFAGAARHAGAGALAVAGAREIAQLGGLGGGGGSSGSGGAGGGGTSNTFEPRGAAGDSNVMALTIITQNALGPDNIQNLSFQLNRAGILKRPMIQLPPTSGITVRAA